MNAAADLSVPTHRWAVPTTATGCSAWALMLTLAAGLIGCAAQPAARVAGDSTADLTAYRTFTFARPLAVEAGGQPSALTQHLEQATLREMRSRGFRQTSNAPQLLININANTPQAIGSVPTPPRLVPGGYYAYRAGQYAVWPGYRDGDAVAPYPAGTINIDVVDATRKQLVWEAVVPGAIPPSPADPLQATVDAAVKAAFANYPVPPGSATR